MGAGCLRCSTSNVKPAGLPPAARKLPTPQLVAQAIEAVDRLASATTPQGPQGLGARLHRAIALAEDLRGAGYSDAALVMEERLVEESWPAFERCLPQVVTPKAVSSTADAVPPPTLGCVGSDCDNDTIALAEDLRTAASQLLGVAVRARAGDDGTPAARLVAHMAEFDTGVALALVNDGLVERNTRLLRYARDRVAACFDAAGASSLLARSLATRLVQENRLVEEFDPFKDPGVVREEGVRSLVEGLRDLLDMIAGTVDAEDEEVEQGDLRGNVRDLHARVLQRLALRTLAGALSGPPSARSVDAAAVALEDLRRAGRLSALEPIDPFGFPTCAAWLEQAVLPATAIDPLPGARPSSWLRACLEHQQVALAAAPFLRSLDMASGLLVRFRERLSAAAGEGRWQGIGAWAHLATGLEVNLRDMLGNERGRQVAQQLCASLAEFAGYQLLAHAAVLLRGAGDPDLEAQQLSAYGAESAELEFLDESDVRKACCNCGLALFYCASTLRRSFAVTERTCPNCFTVQTLDAAVLFDFGPDSQGLAAAAEAEMPVEARALRAYACVSAPVVGGSCAPASPSAASSPSAGPEQRASWSRQQQQQQQQQQPPSPSGGEMHAAHRCFLEVLKGRLQQLADSPRQHVLLACFAIRCHVAGDLGVSAADLAARLDARVVEPGSRLEAELRAALERVAQAEQALAEWRQVVSEAVAAADAGGLRAALAWAGANPSAQGCEEYLRALDAYRRLRDVPEEWALTDILLAGEEVAAWRAAARVAAAGGDLPALRTALHAAAGRQQFEALAECRVVLEAYRRIRRLPDSWDLAEVRKFDDEVARWRSSTESVMAGGDHRALHRALEAAAKAPHLQELEEFRELVERYRELLQLPASWPPESVLRQGPQIADWRERVAPLLRLGPEDVRSSAASLDNLRSSLGKARGCRYMEATEEFEAGVRLLRLALNLPDLWTADEVLHRGEEAAAWRAAAAAAVASRSPRELVCVLLRARRCRFAQSFPEYHKALSCLARQPGRGHKSQLLDIERLPAAWDLEDQPYMVRKDSKGVNVVLRRSLDHFLHSQLLSIIQDIVNKSCQDIRTRDRTEGGKVPLHYNVCLVEHVMNLRNWQVYLRARDRIAAKDRDKRIDAFLRDEELLTNLGPAQQLLREFRAAGGPLKDELNECLLWHGTLPASAEQIANGDFKLALAGSHAGTMYGRGIYFAEAFTKSDEYARKTNDRGERAMLLCRCVMGRYHYCDTEPNARSLEASVLFGEYDSVVGDRRKFRGTYREFVFFDTDLVYPAFLVWYKRSSGESTR